MEPANSTKNNDCKECLIEEDQLIELDKNDKDNLSQYTCSI